jgi:hypothetical protein
MPVARSSMSLWFLETIERVLGCPTRPLAALACDSSTSDATRGRRSRPSNVAAPRWRAFRLGQLANFDLA